MKLKVTRRHLLKGSLAAPLVLTVRSAAGTGMAMTSAAACRVYDKDKYDHDVHKFKKYQDADHWLRKETDICYLKKKDKYGNYQDIDGEYFKGDTGCWWQKVQKGDDCDVYQKADYTDSNCKVRRVVRKEYGLVCVDDRGYVKGYHWEKPSYSPITCSCWASLKIT